MISEAHITSELARAPQLRHGDVVGHERAMTVRIQKPNSCRYSKIALQILHRDACALSIHERLNSVAVAVREWLGSGPSAADESDQECCLEKEFGWESKKSGVKKNTVHEHETFFL